MNSPNIYCEWGYLEDLNRNLTDDNYPIKNKPKLYERFTYLLSSNIILDSFNNEICKSIIPSFEIAKRYFDGKWQVSENWEIPTGGLDLIDFAEIHFKDTFLISEKNKDIIKTRDCTGILFTTISDEFSNNGYFAPTEITINKNDNSYHKWYDIPVLQNPCNSAVIIDPYLIAKQESIEYDFHELIDSFLPKTMEIPFHLTIFYEDNISYTKEQMNAKYNSLAKAIQSVRPQLKVSLSIFRFQGKEFHDRVIITNSACISSGAGFELFGKKHKSKNLTTIKRQYFLIDKEHLHFIECNTIIAKKLINERRVENDQLCNFIGSTNNRLLNE
ncbi:MAG: hypothetical protein KBT45_01010 [Bacteroidales bacterium]|nr:hypothetical protein [Candidatus Colimorpha pelethequi]